MDRLRNYSETPKITDSLRSFFHGRFSLLRRMHAQLPNEQQPKDSYKKASAKMLGVSVAGSIGISALVLLAGRSIEPQEPMPLIIPPTEIPVQTLKYSVKDNEVIISDLSPRNIIYDERQADFSTVTSLSKDGKTVSHETKLAGDPGTKPTITENSNGTITITFVVQP